MKVRVNLAHRLKLRERYVKEYCFFGVTKDVPVNFIAKAAAYAELPKVEIFPLTRNEAFGLTESIIRSSWRVLVCFPREEKMRKFVDSEAIRILYKRTCLGKNV